MSQVATTQEAAAILGLTRSGISRMVKRGALQPVRRLGSFGKSGDGAMLFDLADLVALAEQRRRL